MANEYILADLIFRALDAGIRWRAVQAMIDQKKTEGATVDEVSAALSTMADDAIAKAQAEIDKP